MFLLETNLEVIWNFVMSLGACSWLFSKIHDLLLCKSNYIVISQGNLNQMDNFKLQMGNNSGNILIFEIILMKLQI